MDATRETPNHYSDRLPTLNDIQDTTKMTIDLRHSYFVYDHFNDTTKRLRKEGLTYCLASVFISFIFGLAVGVILMKSTIDNNVIETRTIRSSNPVKLKSEDIDNYSAVSFTGDKYKKDTYKMYPKELTDIMKDMLKDKKSENNLSITINKTYIPNDSTVLYDNIFWGPEIENAMPQGYGESSAEIWEQYMEGSEIIKMESGCGRMQNRLVTFNDGSQACVRYRQNTDQIQGEIFSFYVGRLLNLTNLAPSVIKIVDLKDKLWSSVSNDVATAQWGTNRAVVLTQYIPSLEPATIPDIFKPATRHLNKMDVLNMSLKENSTTELKSFLNKLQPKLKSKRIVEDNFSHIDMKLNKKTVNKFLELAQWSDLIIFDYLTANLDRIVNNLFNYQWNVNIMDGPAHNLAKKMDSGLLLFLDNESGLLHGYRLLKKYNIYHSLMLDNLCVFRKRTIDSLRGLYERQSIGVLLSDMFHKKNSVVIRDILPALPDKNAKILHERIGRVLSQVEKCEQSFR